MAGLTATILNKQTVGGGVKRITAALACDNSYPNPAGYAVTPAMFGLTRFLVDDTGVALIDPEIIALKGSPLLGVIATQALHLYYPTGSTLAAPAAVADPILNAGAVAVTASAATGPFAAGRGKELLNATDASAVVAVAVALGF